MSRRHKAMVLAATLVVVLCLLGFFFVAGALAHERLKIHVNAADDARGVSVSYLFEGQHGIQATREDEVQVLMGSGHSSNELVIDEIRSAHDEDEDEDEGVSDEASGDGEYEDGDEDQDEQSYDPMEQAEQYHQQYEQYDNDVVDGGDASSSADSSVDGEDVRQQVQQQQDQQQDHQQDQCQGQQQGQQQSAGQGAAKALSATLSPVSGVFGCGVDRNILKSCLKPTSPAETELYRVSRSLAELSYLNYECSGVLLGNSTDNVYLLTTADCVYHDTLARSGRVGVTECESATSYSYSKHTLYHVNRTLGYVVIKVNTGGGAIDTIATYAQLSRRGAVVGSRVVVASYSNTYGPSVATTYNRKPIKIQTYKPTGVQSESKQGSCPLIADTTGLVTYMANSMDGKSRGSPVFSVADGSVVALHVCGACIFNSSNTALSSKTILDDLEASSKLRSEFVAA